MSNKLRYGVVTFVLLFSLGFFVQVAEQDLREDKKKLQWQQEKREEGKTVQTGGQIKKYAYRLGLLEDKIVVYKGEEEDIYEYTNLLLENLPYEEQRKVLLGRGFGSEAEMYEFLETYSS